MARSSRFAIGIGVCLMTACGTPAVGAPCLPEQTPQDGFNDQEAYIEASSVQCETRVCMVYRLAGDPRESCEEIPAGCEPSDAVCIRRHGCADPEQVKKRVYCTCRCDAGDTGFSECECPQDYSCVEVLDSGGPGVRGSYCVRNDSVTL